MNEFQATTILVALFALRCVAPFMLLVLIGYGMKRLAAHWEWQDAARAARPSLPVAMVARPNEALRPRVPCWVFNNCDEKTRNACPAFATPSLACWTARLRADGRLPAKCAGCSLYTGASAFAGD